MLFGGFDAFVYPVVLVSFGELNLQQEELRRISSTSAH